MSAQAPAFWRKRGLPARLLFPLALLFGVLARRRRRRARVQTLPVPVIVVGNIAVGGSGKTPVVQWLVAQLRAAGYCPGIVSRGHGARIKGVATVPGNGDAALYGDEPVLLAASCACPLVIGRDRPAAARELLRQHPECYVIVADDGMQHYRLGRELEIAVLDPLTLGNGWLLPAGPLREPLARLREVDLVLAHGALDAGLQAAIGSVPVFSMRLRGEILRSLRDPQHSVTLESWRGRRVHAVAGIGRPQRFFAQLEAAGLEVLRHPFPDHHDFKAQDLVFSEPAPILMTAKDAVKCRAFAPDDSWEFPVQAQIGSGAAERILEKLKNGRTTA